MSRNAPLQGWLARQIGFLLTLVLPATTTWSADAPGAPPPSLASNPPPVRVVIVQNPQATELFLPRLDPVRTMVERGLTALTGQATVAGAWRSLVSTQDVVGLKVYSAPGPTCGTRPAVAAAVVEELLAAGLPRRHLVVWDRHASDLREAGFFDLADRYGVRVEGAAEAGWDERAHYENPLLGSLMWGDFQFGKTGEGVGRSSYVSKLVSRSLTKIINLSPLLNNNLTGVSGNLYSLAFGSVDNTRRFESDAPRMATAVPEIYALPALSDHVVLNIVDALLCQYEGGEVTMLHYSATLNQLRFSRDPVALDVLSIQELDRQRRFAGMLPVKENLELYQNASLLELGVSEVNKLKVETLP